MKWVFKKNQKSFHKRSLICLDVGEIKSFEIDSDCERNHDGGVLGEIAVHTDSGKFYSTGKISIPRRCGISVFCSLVGGTKIFETPPEYDKVFEMGIFEDFVITGEMDFFAYCADPRVIRARILAGYYDFHGKSISEIEKLINSRIPTMEESGEWLTKNLFPYPYFLVEHAGVKHKYYDDRDDYYSDPAQVLFP